MKKMKKRGWTRLMALALVLALVLPGCSAGISENGSQSSGHVSAEDEGTIIDLSGVDMPAELDDEDTEQDGEDTEPSGEDAELLQRAGLMESELVEISEKDASELNQTIAGIWAAYAAGSDGKEPLVKPRDWEIYTSSLGLEGLSRREAELFSRFKKQCDKYLRTSVDAAKQHCSNGKTYSVIGSIRFRDLGLSKDQAAALLLWFAYNYPQYYFITGWYLTTSDEIFPTVYDFMADGEERAEITNELFDKLDGWIQTVAGQAATSYEKELYANNLICETVTYNHDALKEGHEDEMQLCQSLYSTVALEDTVCAGYSKTFTAMMNAMDVEATAGLSLGHAWNVVRMEDGNCYCVDVCWNDTDSNPAYRNRYLNVGDAASKMRDNDSESHTYQKECTMWIPAIAKENYDPQKSGTQSDDNSSDSPSDDSKTKPVLAIRVTEVGPTSVSFFWEPIGDEKTYVAYYYPDKFYEKEGFPIKGQWTSEAKCHFDNLTPDTEYLFNFPSENTYFVLKTLAEGEETITLDPDEALVPPTPADVTMTDTGENTARMEWTPIPAAEEYDICIYKSGSYSENIDGKFYTRSAEEPTQLSWKGLSQGIKFRFGIRACKTVNGVELCSGWTILYYQQP